MHLLSNFKKILAKTKDSYIEGEKKKVNKYQIKCSIILFLNLIQNAIKK